MNTGLRRPRRKRTPVPSDTPRSFANTCSPPPLLPGPPSAPCVTWSGTPPTWPSPSRRSRATGSTTSVAPPPPAGRTSPSHPRRERDRRVPSHPRPERARSPRLADRRRGRVPELRLGPACRRRLLARRTPPRAPRSGTDPPPGRLGPARAALHHPALARPGDGTHDVRARLGPGRRHDRSTAAAHGQAGRGALAPRPACRPGRAAPLRTTRAVPGGGGPPSFAPRPFPPTSALARAERQRESNAGSRYDASDHARRPPTPRRALEPTRIKTRWQSHRRDGAPGVVPDLVIPLDRQATPPGGDRRRRSGPTRDGRTAARVARGVNAHGSAPDDLRRHPGQRAAHPALRSTPARAPRVLGFLSVGRMRHRRPVDRPRDPPAPSQ